MPTFEEVETFFTSFHNKMKDQGIFLFDDYMIPWVGLQSIDEKRDEEVENQYCPEDDNKQ